MSLSELFAYPFCYLLITRLPRKYIAYTCFSVAMICSIVLVFIWKPLDDSESSAENIGILVLVFIFRFFSTMEYTVFYVYYN